MKNSESRDPQTKWCKQFMNILIRLGISNDSSAKNDGCSLFEPSAFAKLHIDINADKTGEEEIVSSSSSSASAATGNCK